MAFNDALLSLNSPNVFEVFAVEHMTHSLRSALKHLVKVVIDRINPNLLLYSDEISLLTEAVFQAFSLWNYDASVAEAFYDLKRVLCFSAKPLKHYERWKSLVTILLIPYVKLKLQDFYSDLHYEDSGVSRNNSYVKIFLKVYPFTIALLNVLKLVIHLRYVCNPTYSHSPILLLIGIALHRQLHVNQVIHHGQNTFSNICQAAASALLPVVLFGFKFIEWWYSPEKETATHSITKLPVPQPPTMKDFDVADDNQLLCPICLKSRRNSTCISSSGFVYCYSCIYERLKQWKKCPVSSIPADHSMLIRLFPYLMD